MLPAWVTVSMFPEMVPAPVLAASMVKTMGLLEPPPVAPRVMVRPGANVAVVVIGAVKVMVCGVSWPTPVTLAVPIPPLVVSVMVRVAFWAPPLTAAKEMVAA